MAFFIQGCKKEHINQPVNLLKIDKSFLETTSFIDHVEQENGVLAFPNSDYLLEVLAFLENEVDNWNTHFLEKHRHFSDDSLSILAEELNFNEEKPLFDFEDRFNFTSLRKIISDNENEWLQNMGESSENDPDNHFIEDETVRTILNQFAEVKIGDAYFKFTENGYYEVTDGNFETLTLLRNPNNDVMSLKNVQFHKSPDYPGDCTSDKRQEGFKDNSSNNKRIKWVVSHWTYPWGRYAIAKTKNYKKQNNKWKKYSTYSVARVYGFISDTTNGTADCSKQLQFNTENGPSKAGIRKKVKHKISVSTKTKSGWIMGYHKGAHGITYTSSLYWY